MKSIELHNNYLCMRHARSIANEQHIIVSDPTTGIGQYGLTFEGKKQVFEAIAKNDALWKITHIYSSDFLRAYQTARIVAKHMNNMPVITDARLRERYFGRFEGSDSENYHAVWDMDCASEFDAACLDVEPVRSVAKRMLSFVLDCENRHREGVILVVSHGDPLQILYAIAKGVPAHRFATLPHFTNAEVRLLPVKFSVQKELVL
jgi:broad specificity phosphatase PhoE